MFDKLCSNLNELIITRDVSVVQLSRSTGVPASTIKKIRNSSNMNPTLATLIPIARFFSLTLDALIFGHEKSELSTKVPVENHAIKSNQWPLISWEKAVYWPGADGGFQEKMLSQQTHNTQTFAVRIDAEDWGIFTKDTILIVDPGVIPAHRDYVLVVKEGQAKAGIRKFLSSDDNHYLQSVCVIEEVIPLSASHKILGVVMEHSKQLKPAQKVGE